MRRKKIKFCAICGKNLNNIEGLKPQSKTCCKEHGYLLRKAYWREWWRKHPEKEYFKDRKSTGLRLKQREKVRKRRLRREKLLEIRLKNTLPMEDKIPWRE